MIHFIAWGVEVKIWGGQILGLVMLAAMVWLFWKAQRDPHNPIDFSTMFVWPATNQTSLILTLTFIAGMAGTWVVVDMEFRSRLTAEIFLGYLGIMVLGKGMTEWTNAWRDRGPPPPAPPPAPNQIIGNAGNVNAAPLPHQATEATQPAQPKPG